MESREDAATGELFFEGVADFGQEHFGASGLERSDRRRSWFAFDFVHNLHKQENAGGDDQKLNDGVEKHPVADDRSAGLLRGGEGFVGFAVERNKEAAEIDTLHHRTDRRHNDFGDEAIDDFSESGTDDHTDSEVDDISTGDELTEFLGDFHLGGVKTESRDLPKKKRVGVCPAVSR